MKYSAHGTEIKVEISTVMTLIAQVDNIGIPTKVAGEIDATDHQSSVKEFIGDLPEHPPFEFSGHWDPADATHAFLLGQVGNTLNFEITVKGSAAPTTNDTLTFSGVLLSFAPQPQPAQGSMMRFSGTIRPGAVTITDSV